MRPPTPLAWFLDLGIGAAVAIEVGQFFMTDRDASLGDMTANVAGIVLGLLASRWLRAGSAAVGGPCPASRRR